MLNSYEKRKSGRVPMELISVIVPVYNAESTILRCLRSILDGEYQHIEVIVVNDGSRDRSSAIVSSIALEDKRVRLINQENKGCAYARNVGLRAAVGKYIAWCDADDWVEPSWLHNLYKFMMMYTADIVVCGTHIDGRKRKMPKENVVVWNKDTAVQKFLVHKELTGVLWNKLFSRELFNDLSFSDELKYYEDSSMMWNVLKRLNGKIAKYYIEDYHYTISDSSITGSKCNEERVSSLKAWKAIYDDCKSNLELYRPLAKQILGHQSFCMMMLMFRDEYYNGNQEKEIKTLLHTCGFDTIKRIDGFAHKLFFVSVMFSTRISRIMYKLMIATRKAWNRPL